MKIHDIHSAICVPLMTRDQITGVLYVDHRGMTDVFSKRDLAFFTTFALQAKAAIDSSRAYWELVESLFRASGDLVVVCSREGRITRANRAATTMAGLTQEEITRGSFEEIVVEEDRGRAARLCSDTIEQGVVMGVELAVKDPTGRPVPLSVSSFSLKDRLGHAIGLCLIGRDLSEIKALINQLTDTNSKLEVRNFFIRQTFGRYLSDEVVDGLLASPDRLELGGERRRVTILLADLRGFTPVAERLEPEQVVHLINNFLGEMVEIITRHQGTIDEIIGDAVLVIFGAPVTREDDARRAAVCALEMQLAMEHVNQRNRSEGLPEVEMGIGLNTGEVVVGNIGSQRRSKYAVVGTAVNLTARIESNTIGGEILVSDETRHEAGGDLVLGRRMELHLKGMATPRTVHQLMGIGGEHDLHLPVVRTEFRTLVRPVAVTFAEIEGKHVSRERYPAEVAELARHGAVLRSERRVAPLENLQVFFPAEGEAERSLFGKVQEEDRPEPNRFSIHFTSVPPETRAVLDILLGNRES